MFPPGELSVANARVAAFPGDSAFEQVPPRRCEMADDPRDARQIDQGDRPHDGDDQHGRSVAVALVILSMSTLLAVVGMLLGAITAQVAAAVAAAAGAAARIWYSRRG